MAPPVLLTIQSSEDVGDRRDTPKKADERRMREQAVYRLGLADTQTNRPALTSASTKTPPARKDVRGWTFVPRHRRPAANPATMTAVSGCITASGSPA